MAWMDGDRRVATSREHIGHLTQSGGMWERAQLSAGRRVGASGCRHCVKRWIDA